MRTLERLRASRVTAVLYDGRRIDLSQRRADEDTLAYLHGLGVAVADIHYLEHRLPSGAIEVEQ
jgi:hypothetical protein